MKRAISFVAKYSGLVFLLVIFIFPLFFVISISVMSKEQSLMHDLLPNEFYLSNFSQLFDQFPLGTWFRNSFYVALIATIVGIVFAFFPAYAMVRMDWKTSQFMQIAILSSILFSPQMMLLPLYAKFSELNMIPSYYPLILPFLLTDAVSVFLLRQFMMAIPLNLYHSAISDGASELTIMRKIVFPLCKPGIYATSFLIFLGCWNDLFQPLIYLTSDQNLWTAPLGLTQINAIHNVNQNLVMAFSVLLFAPIIVLFIFSQKHILKSFDLGK